MADITLTPGVLPPPACYPTEQDRFDAYVAAIIATVTGGLQWQASQVAPTDLTLFWLRLDSNNRPIEALQWSTTDGAWVRWASEVISTGVSGGVANAYTLTNTPAFTAPTAMRPGQIYGMFITAANTAASTLNIDGVGAFPIRLPDDVSPVVAGDLVTSQGVLLMVNLTGNAFLLLSPTSNVAAHGSMLITTTGAGNFTVPGGAFLIQVETVAGGGGGSFQDGGTAVGGGGGGYAYKQWDVLPGQVIPYSVGIAGVKTTSAGGGQNTDGGDTSFNATQISNGGQRGSAGGLGGVFSGSDYGFNGTPGTRATAGAGGGKWAGGVAAFASSQGGWASDSSSSAIAGLWGGGGAADNDAGGGSQASDGGQGLILIKW